MNISRALLLAVLAGLPLSALPAHALITFGPPSALNSTAATDLAGEADDDVDGQVSLATDGTTNWVALWSSDNSLGGTIGSDSDIFVATSSDDGETWSDAEAAMADAATDDPASDNSPRVAAGNGVFVAVFNSSNTLGGTTGTDGDILYTRSTDNGATWSNAALLNSGGTADGGSDLDYQAAVATNGAGTWLAVWKHSKLSAPNGDQQFYSYSTDDGLTWAAEQPLGSLRDLSSSGNGQGTAVAWNGSAFVVVWGSNEDLGSNGNDGDILYSLIAPPGFAATPVGLLNSNGSTDTPTGGDMYPSVTADGPTVIVSWESSANVGGSGIDDDILHARSTDGGSTWSAAAPLASNATTDIGSDNNVALANDGSTFLAVWDSTDPLDKLAKSDRDIFVSRSDDGGVTWSATAVLATTAGKDKGVDEEPAIAVNPATGTWAVAWGSEDTLGKTIGADEDLLFVHSSVDCPAAPVAAGSCFQSTVPGGSSLIVKEAGAKDSFLWKFTKGPLVDKAIDLGSPQTGDDYVLCVYDESANVPSLIVEMDIEAGGNCFVKPCWTDVGTGYTFKHKAGLVASAALIAGTEGTSKASVKAKGAFRAPALPLDEDTTVHVRLHNLANGKCFASGFSTSSSNTAGLYKAKSD